MRVAAPEKSTATPIAASLEAQLDNAERARLESSNAFAELVALNEAKQSVNRPQKVRRSPR